jgi:hypothetical protein
MRLASASLWLGVGLAKMAALAWFIDNQWQPALLALLAAFAMAALALKARAATR